MKYLKTYESIIDELETGDYVVVEPSLGNDELYNFITSNVGKISGIFVDRVGVKFENIPLEMSEDKLFLKNIRYFDHNQIIFRSKNKEDCETFIAAKKYNL